MYLSAFYFLGYIICMEDRYTHVRTCVYNINYHIVWCVKYRRKVLTPENCFVSAPPEISVTRIVKYLKGISGNALLREFPELRSNLWKGQLWNGSYFCETIGSASEEDILRYIERQKDCQL